MKKNKKNPPVMTAMFAVKIGVGAATTTKAGQTPPRWCYVLCSTVHTVVCVACFVGSLGGGLCWCLVV